jgi:hypothetical protein
MEAEKVVARLAEEARLAHDSSRLMILAVERFEHSAVIARTPRGAAMLTGAGNQRRDLARAPITVPFFGPSP